ncbi:MAG TPA: branched-chain amino acid ABC transporter permease [Zoogloea sp.]|uniref:branched-chain amino acid ABC transporter permease n=1 Tax=Zoogloea sp. TaxID=49181 RepID=UPI002BCAE3CC|nr:branched-chain amino acid ABC transporter permease [Zoogloea sp.]HMV62832.1 branched-chain amino acid ABC transporter permease [Rhodocyclaceae bacterium]HMW51568.1 branched-chain amino acid ABC transporter permease [Rhodocyclaceae bacterium]HMY49463.1 branched-chain amino acid ABC transporter permease [Rhodocyclaceae bacterium]HMZ75867.1 branched-chain amino acid ABC transporter permease [Rhodocyclaceae bacterium]HNA67307.1 branched-chain amino acid ABC transporter permease [Rhodocyclaceae 
MNASRQPTALIKPEVLYTALFIVGLIAPFAVYPTFLMKLFCFALFASAFNLLLGFAGLLSFGHAAFLGSAGYVCGMMVRDVGVTPEVGILAGTAAAGLLGWLFGVLAIRRTGIYFAMITLALAQMVYFIVLQVKATGGEDGLQGVPRGHLFGFIDLTDNLAMYYLVYGVFALGFFIIHRTIHSPFGQILKAIRENEPRAISLGYDVSRFKLIAFVISASLAGLAGATKTLVFQLVSLSDVHWHMSGEVVLMTLLGGLGTILGPSVGSGVIVTLQNELADKVGSWVTVIMGAIFVLCVLAFRRGLVGEIQALIHKAGIR